MSKKHVIQQQSNWAAECAGIRTPTGAVAEAVELIKCSLLAADHAGESPAGQRAALLGRFTEEQLASAYSFLVAHGQVYAGGISKAYALSDSFKASLQVRPCVYVLVQMCLLDDLCMLSSHWVCLAYDEYGNAGPGVPGGHLCRGRSGGRVPS